MSVLGHRVPDERGEALARVGAIIDEPRFHPHLTGRDVRFPRRVRREDPSGVGSGERFEVG